jgi:hypothetical protein
LLFGLTVKTSLRPDRRYQAVHEANTLKAVVAHLSARLWDRGISCAYYTLTQSASDADVDVFHTAAIQSVVDVNREPMRAVDGVAQVDTIQRARNVFDALVAYGEAPLSVPAGILVA